MPTEFLEAAVRGVGVTRGRNWRVAPRFRPILGLTGVGLLVLVAADVLVKSPGLQQTLQECKHYGRTTVVREDHLTI